MNYLLFFPPSWVPTQPYLSLPSLTAYLRSKGNIVTQRDLNLEFYYWLCNSKTIKQLYKILEQKKITNCEESEILRLLKDFLITKSELWIENLKNKDYFFSLQPFKYGQSLDILSSLLKLISLAYSPQEISIGTYNVGKKINDAKDLLREIDLFQNNLFYDFYCSIVSNKSMFLGISLIGISIIGQEQLLPGLVLAKMLKNTFPSIPICVGGPIMTRLKDSITKNENFFKFLDFIILFEGELPLYRLGKALQSKIDLNMVPNLLYYSKNKVQYTFTQQGLAINNIPTPDFEGLFLEKYLSPEISLPLLTSRGCYWDKCTFCDHSYIYNSNFRIRKIENILEDINILHEKYNAQHINFVDECIPPKTFNSLSHQLPDLSFKIFWSCDLRFDEIFVNKKLFEKAYDSGLRVIFFGMESGCQRILDLMNKGIEINNIKKILSASSNAGIWNHLFGIFAFPTETKKEFETTIKFLKENNNLIHSVGFARFSLNRYSPISLNPKLYNISKLTLLGDIRLDLDYECNSGMNKEEIKEIDEHNNKCGYSVSPYLDNFLRVFHTDLWYIYLSKFSTADLKCFYSTPTKTEFLLEIDTKIKLKEYIFFNLDRESNKVLMFDMLLGKYLEFTIETKDIFESLVYPTSIDKLSKKLAEIFGITLTQSRNELLIFIKELYDTDLITIA